MTHIILSLYILKTNKKYKGFLNYFRKKNTKLFYPRYWVATNLTT